MVTSMACIALSCAFATATTEFNSSVSIEAIEYQQQSSHFRTSETWITPSADFFAKFGVREQLRLKLGLHGQLLVVSRAPHSESSGGLELNQTGSPRFLEEKEAAVEYRFRRGQISLGSQIVRWGVSDVYDPLDQINARRFERPLDTLKRSEWMARGSYMLIQRNSFSISAEGLWIPIKKAPLLPSTSSAWLPRDIYIPQDTSGAILEVPESVGYRYRPQRVLNGALENAFGLRLQLKTESTEWSAQYDEGAQGFPTVAVFATGQLVELSPRPRVRVDSNIDLEAQIRRERRYGLSFVRQFRWLGKEWLTRAQVARTEPIGSIPSTAGSMKRTDWMFGLERSFSSRLLGSITGLMQLFYNSETGGEFGNPTSSGNDATSTNQIFDQAASVGARMSLSDTTTLLIGGIWSPKDTVFQTQMGIALTDELNLDLSLNLIEANRDSALGAYRNNDSLSARITAFF